MMPKPPKGYRLAVKGESYDPGDNDKPALWYNPHIGKWKVWGRLYSIETVEEAEGVDYVWSIYAVPKPVYRIPLEVSAFDEMLIQMNAMAELVQLSQELGLYDMTDNPLVKGDSNAVD